MKLRRKKARDLTAVPVSSRRNHMPEGGEVQWLSDKVYPEF